MVRVGLMSKARARCPGFIKNPLKGTILQSEREINYILTTILHFLKPFLKGNILRSSERGVNSILTTILHY